MGVFTSHPIDDHFGKLHVEHSVVTRDGVPPGFGLTKYRDLDCQILGLTVQVPPIVAELKLVALHQGFKFCL